MSGHADQLDGRTMPLPNGCVLWTFSRNSDGYGTFKVDGQTHMAHREAYEAAHGPLPAGAVLDHLCRHEWCVNVAHLEAVTMRENTARGFNHVAENIRKTHCHRGHPLAGSNLYVPANGKRECKACRRAAVKRYEQRRAA